MLILVGRLANEVAAKLTNLSGKGKKKLLIIAFFSNKYCLNNSSHWQFPHNTLPR